ncbi:hypothetical protein RB598_000272 [Gaeumannomyces tritici]
MFRPASDDTAAIPSLLFVSASQPKVDFVHPGYDGDFISAAFLSLPPLDDGGVCFDTAIAACGLIACNQWAGYLSTDKAGQNRVARPADGILRNRPYYYFHVPVTGSFPYPIIPRFSDWTFPHGNLPAPWARLQLQTNPNIQGQCIATKYSHGVDSAHCVPSSESEWWDFNYMGRYSSSSAVNFSTQPQDSPANLIPLRADFHRVFDGRHLCFVPKEVKPSDSAAIQTCLYIHVFVPSYNGQVAGLWHNRALHPLPPGLSKECLFARFAYTVLSPAVFASSVFLGGSRVARHLCTRDPKTQTPTAKMESPDSCRRISRTARSRSPRKRSAPPGNDDDAGGCSEGDSNSGYLSRKATLSGTYGLPFQLLEEEEEEEERGRSRKRARVIEGE